MSTLKDCRLRPVQEGDLGLILNWRNSERVHGNMFTDHVITMEEHRQWFRKMTESSSDIYLVFEWRERPLGLVYFTDLDSMNKRCAWGFYLGEENLPRGTGTIMGMLGIDYAFEKLKISKLCGETLAFNNRAIVFHQKLGFSCEGTLVKHMLKNNKFEDVVLFALFADEWPAIRPKIQTSVFQET